MDYLANTRSQFHSSVFTNSCVCWWWVIGVLEICCCGQKINGGMSDGMARNGVMARGMAEWSNGGIDGNGQMAGMAEWRNG